MSKRPRITRQIQNVLTVVFTAALFALLFDRWLFVPFPTGWILREQIFMAMIGSFVVGAFTRLWIRNVIILAVSGCIGLISGAAWAEHSISDVTISFSYALMYSIEIYWWIEILLLSSLIASWLITDYFLKKVKVIKLR